MIDMHSYALYFITTVSDRSVGAAAKIFSREYGISLTEWRILVLLSMESPARPGQFVEFAGVDKSNVSRALGRLRKEGYVIIEPDPQDPRLNLVHTTDAGMAVHHRTSEIARRHEEVILEGLNARERVSLLALLRRLLRNSEALVNNSQTSENG